MFLHRSGLFYGKCIRYVTSGVPWLRRAEISSSESNCTKACHIISLLPLRAMETKCKMCGEVELAKSSTMKATKIMPLLSHNHE